MQETLGITDAASSPATLSAAHRFGTPVLKNPEKWAVLAFAVPPSLTNIRIGRDGRKEKLTGAESHLWHDDKRFFCLPSVSRYLVFNLSGPQYLHLSNGDNKTHFSGFGGMLYIIIHRSV